jgi:hypothetical protein
MSAKEYLQIRISPQDRTILEAEAKNNRLPLSSFCRMILFKHLKEKEDKHE